MSDQPLLALCMIVRDGEKTIGSLLDSVLNTDVGPAMDEYVFVDTGSVDATKKIIANAFGFEEWHLDTHDTFLKNRPVKVTFAEFTWVENFAKARNYAFGLATAKWRMYLDADDVLPNAQKLRAGILVTERNSQRSNCISLGYTYIKDRMQQDVMRVVRWADGWVWERALHEHMVRVVDGVPQVGGRVLSKYTDINVVHSPTDEGVRKSLSRNLEICQRERAAALERGDAADLALYGKYIAEYLAEDGQFAMAEQLYRESFANAPNTNLSVYARLALCKMFLTQNKFDEALALAGETYAHAPDFREGLAMCATLQTMRGQHARAAMLFDKLADVPQAEFESIQDQEWMNGIVPCHAVLSYVAVGNLTAAQRSLNSIPEGVARLATVQQLFMTAQTKLMRAIGMGRLRSWLEYLIWTCEPIRARTLLNECIPAALDELPEVAAIRRELDAKLPHLTGFAGYCAAYASIPAEDFHTREEFVESVYTLGRHVALFDFVSKIDAEGPAISWLSIGFQDGLVEARCLRMNKRLQLTVCDVGPQAGVSFDNLVAEFGSRVTRHEITHDCTDWAPVNARFDIVSMFEVIEHVPDETEAMLSLQDYVKPAGTLFMSTPVSDHWIEPYLTGPNGPPFFGHVRGFNPTKLYDMLGEFGFYGNIYATENGSIFIAQMQRAIMKPPLKPRIAIYVPHTPLPFDAEAHLHGHVGGSEEAVIHLSKALSVRYDVEVYCPRPIRADGKVFHVSDNVLWRDVAEFDYSSTRFHSVLFWRCPGEMLRPDVKAASYKKLVWAHDTHYGSPPRAYELADATIALSECHETILREEAGHTANIVVAANGVDVPSLPDISTIARIPHSVIYASSPDRGLANLLEMWPSVKLAVPDAVLDVYYTWELVRDEKVLALRTLAQSLPGVTVHGGVDHDTLHKAYAAHEVWCYPVDSFREISCISAMKAMCLGCEPLVFDIGALAETLARADAREATLARTDGLVIMKEYLVDALLNPTTDTHKKARADKARAVYSWDVVAKRFAEIIG